MDCCNAFIPFWLNRLVKEGIIADENEVASVGILLFRACSED